MVRRVLTTVVAAALLLIPGPVLAQTEEEGIVLITPFPGIVVEGGSTASFPIQVSGTAGAQAALAANDLPSGWEATFQSEGATIDRVAVTSAETPRELTLEVAVPDGAEEGSYEFNVSADSATLPLSVTVRAGVAGEVTLIPDFPGLRGPADGDFSFQVDVSNDTPADVELELAGTGPDGWQVTAEPTGQAQASVITVAAGASETVNLDATPPPDADAGVYEIGMTATGEGVAAELTVGIEIIGDYSLSITTPDQRLNAEVTIGEASEFPIIVVNDGTAPLAGLTLSSTAPTDWEVTMEPQTIDQVPPGESATVTALITPAANALAGDYDLTFTATADTASDSMDIRTTVSPSALWGIVGVGLIALTLAGLALVFRRFGRR